ncbi:MAG: hypothetical protein LBG96_11020 [Tannerella sp.]|jgi:hypothetical protein|nr:hypothetical protein [Tannerella sp.]
MKGNVLNLGLGLLSAFLFFSCLSDDDDDVYVSYGVIQNVHSAGNYEILTDKGNTLVVTKTYTTETIEEDKRVLVNYEILSDKDKSRNIYEVRVNGFYNLLSKPLVNESFILQDEEARRDSIGNDPFSHIYAVFGGNFINIDFEVWHLQSSNEKHMINLVYDDTRAGADTIYLTLYHNAYGEVPGKVLSLYRGTGRSSFKISDLLPEGVSAKPVKLTWTQYGSNYEPQVYSDSGTFKLGNASDTNESLLRNIGLDSSIEVK